MTYRELLRAFLMAQRWNKEREKAASNANILDENENDYWHRAVKDYDELLDGEIPFLRNKGRG